MVEGNFGILLKLSKINIFYFTMVEFWNFTELIVLKWSRINTLMVEEMFGFHLLQLSRFALIVTLEIYSPYHVLRQFEKTGSLAAKFTHLV